MSSTLLGQPSAQTLLAAVTGSTNSSTVALKANHRYVIAASVAGTGAVASNVLVYGSAQDVDAAADVTRWTLLTTIALTGTTSDADAAILDAPWRWLYVRAEAISGTGAAVTVDLGEG